MGGVLRQLTWLRTAMSELVFDCFYSWLLLVARLILEYFLSVGSLRYMHNSFVGSETIIIENYYIVCTF